MTYRPHIVDRCTYALMAGLAFCFLMGWLP